MTSNLRAFPCKLNTSLLHSKRLCPPNTLEKPTDAITASCHSGGPPLISCLPTRRALANTGLPAPPQAHQAQSCLRTFAACGSLCLDCLSPRGQHGSLLCFIEVSLSSALATGETSLPTLRHSSPYCFFLFLHRIDVTGFVQSFDAHTLT